MEPAGCSVPAFVLEWSSRLTSGLKPPGLGPELTLLAPGHVQLAEFWSLDLSAGAITDADSPGRLDTNARVRVCACVLPPRPAFPGFYFSGEHSHPRCPVTAGLGYGSFRHWASYSQVFQTESCCFENKIGPDPKFSTGQGMWWCSAPLLTQQLNTLGFSWLLWLNAGTNTHLSSHS